MGNMLLCFLFQSNIRRLIPERETNSLALSKVKKKTQTLLVSCSFNPYIYRNVKNYHLKSDPRVNCNVISMSNVTKKTVN